MIEQKRELWPPDGDRERHWQAVVFGKAGELDTVVILRKYAVLQPGEDLTEYPPTIEMTWGEWAAGHADYGMDIDGSPLSV